MGSGIKICGTAKPSIASHALRRARCAVTPGNAGTLLVDWAVARRAARIWKPLRKMAVQEASDTPSRRTMTAWTSGLACRTSEMMESSDCTLRVLRAQGKGGDWEKR